MDNHPKDRYCGDQMCCYGGYGEMEKVKKPAKRKRYEYSVQWLNNGEISQNPQLRTTNKKITKRQVDKMNAGQRFMRCVLVRREVGKWEACK